MTDILIPDHPTALPPATAASAAADSLSAPSPTAGPATTTSVHSVPTLDGPTSMAAAAADSGDAAAAAWAVGVVDALWSIDETRNGWLRIVGVGWRKVFAGGDNAYLAMMLLGAQSRQTGSPIHAFVADDNQIHTIYLW